MGARIWYGYHEMLGRWRECIVKTKITMFVFNVLQLHGLYIRYVYVHLISKFSLNDCHAFIFLILKPFLRVKQQTLVDHSNLYWETSVPIHYRKYCLQSCNIIWFINLDGNFFTKCWNIAIFHFPANVGLIFRQAKKKPNIILNEFGQTENAIISNLTFNTDTTCDFIKCFLGITWSWLK